MNGLSGYAKNVDKINLVALVIVSVGFILPLVALGFIARLA